MKSRKEFSKGFLAVDTIQAEELVDITNLIEPLMRSYSDLNIKVCDNEFYMTLEDCKKKMIWGTYGVNQRPEDFKWVLLIDCSTEHLQNILKTQHQISSVYRKTISAILDDRK